MEEMMGKDANIVTGSAVATGAAAGIASVSHVDFGAVAVAEMAGLLGTAATSSALATLGGDAVAAGGGRMGAGVLSVASAAAWPAAIVALSAFACYQIFKRMR
jgi:hypothetical protein